MRLEKRKKYSAFAVLLVVILVSFCLMVQNRIQEAYDMTGSAMSTVVRFHLYGKKAEEKSNILMQDINILENDFLSWRISGSEVARLNQSAGGGGVEVNARLKGWLDRIYEIERDSNGALDITVAPVAKLWNIESEHPRVPDETELKEALNRVNYKNILLDGGQSFRLLEGTQIDLGAVGKGIACEELAYTLRHADFCSGTISVGGSIAVVGHKPDGTPWKLGIQNPRGETGEVMGVLSIKDNCFLSTSGDYEKYFMEDNKRYHHILDPRTGRPAQSGLISVTIISEYGLDSDALSTACFVLGLEEGMALAEKYHAEAIFIDEHKQVTITEGLKESFEITNDAYRLVE